MWVCIHRVWSSPSSSNDGYSAGICVAGGTATPLQRLDLTLWEARLLHNNDIRVFDTRKVSNCLQVAKSAKPLKSADGKENGKRASTGMKQAQLPFAKKPRAMAAPATASSGPRVLPMTPGS